ncbi:hypothetical protein MNV49_002967 [Pseudohyphozyma bogoriensis]|nr:hypothetical protein MNV49_002967 [Pseudohyphozyma bogoriensis]
MGQIKKSYLQPALTNFRHAIEKLNASSVPEGDLVEHVWLRTPLAADKPLSAGFVTKLLEFVFTEGVKVEDLARGTNGVEVVYLLCEKAVAGGGLEEANDVFGLHGWIVRFTDGIKERLRYLQSSFGYVNKPVAPPPSFAIPPKRAANPSNSAPSTKRVHFNNIPTIHKLEAPPPPKWNDMIGEAVMVNFGTMEGRWPAVPEGARVARLIRPLEGPEEWNGTDVLVKSIANGAPGEPLWLWTDPKNLSPLETASLTPTGDSSDWTDENLSAYTLSLKLAQNKRKLLKWLKEESPAEVNLKKNMPKFKRENLAKDEEKRRECRAHGCGGRCYTYLGDP